MQAGAGFLIFLSKENSYEDQDPSGYRFYYNYCGSDFSDLRRDHGSEQLSDPLLSETYGLSEQVDLLSGNSMQVFNRLTINSQKKIRDIA